VMSVHPYWYRLPVSKFQQVDPERQISPSRQQALLPLAMQGTSSDGPRLSAPGPK
jgi:hypothetical protein